MDHLAIEEVDEVRLAGAFGSQIDPVHAMILGLIPDCDLASVRSAGNAAGTGALIALLSRAARTEIEGVVRQVEKIETAVEPRFQQHFVEAMAFPHKTAPFPEARGRRHVARATARQPRWRTGAAQRATPATAGAPVARSAGRRRRPGRRRAPAGSTEDR